MIEKIIKEFKEKLDNSDLKKQELDYFRDYIQSNLKEIKNLQDIWDINNCGLLFSIMLELENFEVNLEKRKELFIIAYYILSKAIKKFDNELEDNFMMDDLTIPFLNLLYTRIFLFKNSSDFINKFMQENNIYYNIDIFDESVIIYDCSKLLNINNNSYVRNLDLKIAEIANNVIKELNANIYFDSRIFQGEEIHYDLFFHCEDWINKN
jgi:hypothetical protein